MMRTVPIVGHVKREQRVVRETTILPGKQEQNHG
jgi:hypothetical protein